MFRKACTVRAGLKRGLFFAAGFLLKYNLKKCTIIRAIFPAGKRALQGSESFQEIIESSALVAPHEKRGMPCSRGKLSVNHGDGLRLSIKLILRSLPQFLSHRQKTSHVF
jgi:hypothetical protein